jgi:hypothetical protein
MIMILAIGLIFVYMYSKKEHMDFGENVPKSPFYDYRKMATNYPWNHGCFGRDYGCYDRDNCKNGNCGKKCWSVCRRPVNKPGNHNNVYTNCYDSEHFNNVPQHRNNSHHKMIQNIQTAGQRDIDSEYNDALISCNYDSDCDNLHDQSCKQINKHKICGLSDRFPKN